MLDLKITPAGTVVYVGWITGYHNCGICQADVCRDGDTVWLENTETGSRLRPGAEAYATVAEARKAVRLELRSRAADLEALAIGNPTRYQVQLAIRRAGGQVIGMRPETIVVGFPQCGSCGRSETAIAGMVVVPTLDSNERVLVCSKCTYLYSRPSATIIDGAEVN